MRSTPPPEIVAGVRPAAGHAAVSSAEPVLRDRTFVGFRLGELRRHRRRMGAGAGDLRFRSSASPIQLSGSAADADRERSPGGGGRRVPRLHPSRSRLVPLPQHSRALLQRLSRRHRRSAGPGADGFQRLVRSLSRGSMVHLRRAAQSAEDWPHLDRPRARRRRHSDDRDLRVSLAYVLHRRDRRDQGNAASIAA